MTLLRIRRAAQLTLPANVRQALNVHDGDYLEAEVVAGGVLLKPVAFVERKRAFERIETILAGVRDTQPEKADDRAEEEAIAEEVKAARRKNKNG